MSIIEKRIVLIARWCWATLPRKIMSTLVILGILSSSLWYLFRAESAEAGIPVLWLKFDEGYGTTAYDMTDNGNDFTLSAESWTGYGKYSRAWYGDGAKWVSRANDADLDFIAADNFSISMWVKSSSADNPASQEFLIDKESSSAGYAIYFDTDGDIIFGIDDDATWTPDDKVGDIGVDYYDGTWHHITATKEGTTAIKIYIDGVLKDTDSTIAATGTLANSDSIVIGSQDTSDDADDFNGYIDEVKIYSYKMTDEQIKIDYNHGVSAKMGSEYTPPAGLVGWWDMDEASGGTAYDKSSNANDGTLVGDTSWKNAADCKYGSCLSFDGAGDYVHIGDTSQTGIRTVAFWAKPDSVTVTEEVLDLNGTAYVKITNGTVSGEEFASPTTYVNGVSGATTVTTNWNHIAITTGTGINANDMDIGRLETSSDFDGKIDQVMIYDRALSEHEIAELYEVGRAQKATAGEWRFDEGYGTTAYDDSAQGKNGTITGGATYTPSGKFGRALDFAGDNDYVDVGATGVSVKSVSLWVKPDSVGVTEYPLDLNGTGYVQIANGTVTGQGFTSPTIYVNGIAGVNTVDTNWNHIVITTATSISASDLDIGRKDAAYFSGFIDEVKVYPFVLSAEDVKLEYNRGMSAQLGGAGNTASEYCPPGFTGVCTPPVAHWKMDEYEDGTCAGGTNDVCDSAGNNDGAINGNPVWKNAADCKYGSCLSFDGNGDYINMGAVSGFTGIPQITVAQFVKAESIGVMMVSISQVQSGDPCWRIARSASNYWGFTVANGTKTITVSTAVHWTDNNWHFIVGIYDGANVYLYIDNVLEGGPTALTGNIKTATTGVLNIGGFNSGSYLFNGTIDDVMIFNRALTAEEIAWLYSRGR